MLKKLSIFFMFYALFFLLVALHALLYRFFLNDVLQEGHTQYHWRPKAFEKEALRFYSRLRLAYFGASLLLPVLLTILIFWIL